MARHVAMTELERVWSAVATHEAGAGFEEIAAGLSPPLARRTLQRRLAALVAQGRITSQGTTRSVVYRALAREEPGKADAESADVGTPAQGEESDVAFVPSSREFALSPVGQRLREAVRAPLWARKPVGYNRAFLEGYRPNETAYLSPALKKRLASAGHPPQDDLPAGTFVRQIYHRLLIDLSWNSSRLEGNTYSLLETERLLELGEGASGKQAREAQMILNHKDAIEMLVENAGGIAFNRYTLFNLHALLCENLLPDPDAGGRLRNRGVAIGGSVFHPLEGPQLLTECFDLLLSSASAIRDPFEQAFFVMVQLPYLQPFEDVNKRVSRLSANIPFIRHNLCPISFVEVPQRDYVDGLLAVYELGRVDLLREVFVWAYERSCERYAAVRQSLGEPDPFRLRYRNQLREIVGEIVRQLLDKRAAHTAIVRAVESLPEPDRMRFIEVAETELRGLHEGNFARYRVRPSEFEKWRENWR